MDKKCIEWIVGIPVGMFTIVSCGVYIYKETKAIFILTTILAFFALIIFFLIYFFNLWRKEKWKREALEREIKVLKEVPEKQKKKLDENKKDDKEVWKLFRQLLREKEKNVRLEESVEKKELERKVEKLESKLIKITNEKENKEKEFSNRLFQLETITKNLKLANYQLEKEVFFLRREKKDSEKELSYRELINRRDKQRLEKETDKLNKE